MVGPLIGIALVGVLGYAAWRYVRGDWSASSVEDRPEDSAYDDDWDEEEEDD